MIVHNGADLFWILAGLGLMFFLVCAGFSLLKFTKQNVDKEDEEKLEKQLDMNSRLAHDIDQRLADINKRFAPRTIVHTVDKQGK